MHPMAHGQETRQLAHPTTIARSVENLLVSRFQIAFGFEADRGQGAVTRFTPKEENVGVFCYPHHKVLARRRKNRAYHTWVMTGEPL